MAVIADLVQRPTLDAADLAREKQVIAQEIAEAADTPDDLVFELAQAAAFAGQPLGRPILGTGRAIGTADAGDAWTPGAPASTPPTAWWSAPPAPWTRTSCCAWPSAAFGDAAGAAAPPEPPAAAFTGGVRRSGQAAGAGAPGPAAAGARRARPGLFRPAPVRRDPGRRHVLAPVPGGARAAAAWPTPSTPMSETYADTGVLGVYAGCAAKDAGRDCAQVAAGEIAGPDRRRSATAELARAKAQLKGSHVHGPRVARSPAPNRPPARCCCSAACSTRPRSPRRSTRSAPPTSPASARAHPGGRPQRRARCSAPSRGHAARARRFADAPCSAEVWRPNGFAR